MTPRLRAVYRVHAVALVLYLLAALVLVAVVRGGAGDAQITTTTDGMTASVWAEPGAGIYPVFSTSEIRFVGEGRIVVESQVAFVFSRPPVYLPWVAR